MKTSDFYYELPEELIAQDPLEDRSSSRLMVLNRSDHAVAHRRFSDICEYLRPGDCLVRNNTRVIPARLLGRKRDTGAHAEIFLLKRRTPDSEHSFAPAANDSDYRDVWETLVRPGRKLREGAVVEFGNKDGTQTKAPLTAEILQVLPDGNRLVRFYYEKGRRFEEVLDQLGTTPLPPYIHHELADRERYQTVYARYDGSAAAPTAGLHFTDELFQKIRSMGVRVAEVTLHVGLGTFRPVSVEDVTEHTMHSEWIRILPEEADLINRTKSEGGRVICVGTTSCRTIESMADEHGFLRAGEGDTDIFIYPGYSFKITDALITNFHLPESTLLMLVSALAGKDFILSAYQQAVTEKYRFFSFGDAMLIL